MTLLLESSLPVMLRAQKVFCCLTKEAVHQTQPLSLLWLKTPKLGIWWLTSELSDLLTLLLSGFTFGWTSVKALALQWENHSNLCFVIFNFDLCVQVDCGTNGVSYGRRRRNADSEDLSAGVAQNGRAIVWSDQTIINPRGTHPHDIETDILVFGPQPIVFPINLTSTETSNAVLTTSNFIWVAFHLL